MSIPNLIYKIKSKSGIDKVSLIYMFILVGVGIGAFGLGRLSVSDSPNVKSDISIAETADLSVNKNTTESNNNYISQIQQSEKRYVASKNGKMYYSLDCSGSKRIKPENQVWFNTTSDAEKSGYTLSSTCK